MTRIVLFTDNNKRVILDGDRTSCSFLLLRFNSLVSKFYSNMGISSEPLVLVLTREGVNLVTSAGNRVNVGNFDSDGLNVNRNHPDNSNDNLGRAAARNFCLSQKRIVHSFSWGALFLFSSSSRQAFCQFHLGVPEA